MFVGAFDTFSHLRLSFDEGFGQIAISSKVIGRLKLEKCQPIFSISAYRPLVPDEHFFIPSFTNLPLLVHHAYLVYHSCLGDTEEFFRLVSQPSAERS